MEVVVQTLAARKLPLSLPADSSSKQLYEQVSAITGIPCDKLTLIHQGKSLPATSDERTAVRDGDTILAMSQRIRPSERIQRATTHTAAAEDQDDPATFRIPDDARPWERAMARLLQTRLRCPDLLLTWLFIIRPTRLLLFLLVLCSLPLAARYELGPVVIVVTIIAAIFTNLGTRKPGEASAYSIFNTGVARLPGQLDADAVDQQIRRGQM